MPRISKRQTDALVAEFREALASDTSYAVAIATAARGIQQTRSRETPEEERARIRESHYFRELVQRRARRRETYARMDPVKKAEHIARAAQWRKDNPERSREIWTAQNKKRREQMTPEQREEYNAKARERMRLRRAAKRADSANAS